MAMVSNVVRMVRNGGTATPDSNRDDAGHAPEREIDDAYLAAQQPGELVRKVGVGSSLYLWLMPNGSRLWRWRFRLAGKQREYAIGAFGTSPGEYTLAAARAKAKEATQTLKEGRDPVQQRELDRVLAAGEQAKARAEQKAKLLNFTDLAEEWFKVRSKKWSPNYKQAQRSRLDNEILPVIGKSALGNIDAQIILELLRGIEKREKHELLSKCRVIVSQVYRYGVSTGRAKDDPTSALRGAFEKPTEVNRATIPLKEFPKLFEAIAKVPAEDSTKLAFYFCAATACRTSEMRYATWDELDEIEIVDEGQAPTKGKRKLGNTTKVKVWTLSPSRMKMKKPWMQPLSPLALAILERAKALRTSDDDTALIFPGFSPKAKLGALSENALLSLLARAGFFGRQTTHGLRGSFSSWAHPRGFDALAVELCLAHRPGGVLGVYNKSEYLKQRLAILTAWGNVLTERGLLLP